MNTPETKQAEATDVPTTEAPLSPEKALQAVRQFIDPTILSNCQYAYVGEDVHGCGGRVCDAKNGVWTFKVVSQPFFDNECQRTVGNIMVASDGTVTSTPSLETMIREIDNDQELYCRVTLMRAAYFILHS